MEGWCKSPLVHYKIWDLRVIEWQYISHNILLICYSEVSPVEIYIKGYVGRTNYQVP